MGREELTFFAGISRGRLTLVRSSASSFLNGGLDGGHGLKGRKREGRREEKMSVRGRPLGDVP